MVLPEDVVADRGTTISDCVAESPLTRLFVNFWRQVDRKKNLRFELSVSCVQPAARARPESQSIDELNANVTEHYSTARNISRREQKPAFLTKLWPSRALVCYNSSFRPHDIIRINGSAPATLYLRWASEPSLSTIIVSNPPTAGNRPISFLPGPLSGGRILTVTVTLVDPARPVCVSRPKRAHTVGLKYLVGEHLGKVWNVHARTGNGITFYLRRPSLPSIRTYSLKKQGL